MLLLLLLVVVPPPCDEVILAIDERRASLLSPHGCNTPVTRPLHDCYVTRLRRELARGRENQCARLGAALLHRRVRQLVQLREHLCGDREVAVSEWL